MTRTVISRVIILAIVLISWPKKAEANLFLNIVKLDCGQSIATGTIVKIKKITLLLTVDHFVESCSEMSLFHVKLPKENGTWQTIASIPPKQGKKNKSIYHFVIDFEHKIPKMPRRNQIFCVSYSSLLESIPRDRQKHQKKLEKIFEKYEAILKDTKNPQAGIQFAVRSIQEDSSLKFLVIPFIDFISRQSTLDTSLGALSHRRILSDIRDMGSQIYRIESTTQASFSLGETFTVDCEGSHGSSGGTLVDRDQRVIGLIIGSENELGAIFNQVAPIGRLLLHKFESNEAS